MSSGRWLLLCVLVTLAQPLSAQKIFVVGVQNFDEYLPYSESRGGNYQGFNRRLLDMFAASRGYTFQYHPLPIKRLLRNFLLDQIDLKYPDNPNWARDAKLGYEIVYSDPVVSYIDGVMVTPQRQGMGLDKLSSLGMVLGFSPVPPYPDLIQQGKISLFQNSDLNRLINKVLLGQLDGVYMNVAVANSYLQHKLGQPGALIFNPGLPHREGTRHLSSINHSQLIAEFNQFMRQRHEEIAALKREYGINP